MLYSIRNLVKERKGAQGYVLSIAHFDMANGDMLAITGPSGCGKSTTMDILGLALNFDAADCFTFTAHDKEHDIAGLFQKEKSEVLASLRKHFFGYVLQTGELVPSLPVLDNMMLTARLKGMKQEEARERAFELSEYLGIQNRLHAYPETLSVGERQRAAIVRALVPKPPLLLADEPTAALDPCHAGAVLTLLLDLVSQEKTSLILVTHDIELLRRSHIRELRFFMHEEDGRVCAILDDRKAQSLQG